MAPVLEKVTALRRIACLIQKFHRVSAQARKYRKVMRPHQDVYGVDLEHPDAIGYGKNMPSSHSAGRSITEALRPQNRSPRFSKRKHGPRYHES
jgi:hypothetical protein